MIPWMRRTSTWYASCSRSIVDATFTVFVCRRSISSVAACSSWITMDISVFSFSSSTCSLSDITSLRTRVLPGRARRGRGTSEGGRGASDGERSE